MAHPYKSMAKGGCAVARGRYQSGGTRGAVNVARARNSFSRATGYPNNQGALSVQKYSDMNEAERVSDAVPRKGE